jgi:hypothetical protein
VSEDWAGAEPVDAEFEVAVPLTNAPTHVARLFGDKFDFVARLEELMASDGPGSAVLRTTIPTGPAGPDVTEHVAALDSIGGATVREVVPIDS